jgi:hypothetical protein
VSVPKQVDPQLYREALWWVRRGVENDDPVESWAARILLEMLARYENGITWGTSCENCANLLDQLYAGNCEQERTEGDLAVAVQEATEARAAFRVARAVRSHDHGLLIAVDAALRADDQAALKVAHAQQLITDAWAAPVQPEETQQ